MKPYIYKNGKPRPKLVLTRVCLRCLEEFASWGAGNRRCSRCEGAVSADESVVYEEKLRSGGKELSKRLDKRWLG